jgi:hypothetical protein
MRMMIKSVMAGALVSLATSAYAVPIEPSPTIVSGDKTFNDFTCTSATAGLCAATNVVAHMSPGGPGLEFGLPVAGVEDVIIKYDAISSGALFHDISMTFDGNAGTNVHEQVFIDNTATLIGDITVTGAMPSASTVLTQDVSAIDVVKNISSSVPGGILSIVDQNFSQVPEPASLAILGASLLGFGAVYRRRFRK